MMMPVAVTRSILLRVMVSNVKAMIVITVGARIIRVFYYLYEFPYRNHKEENRKWQ